MNMSQAEAQVSLPAPWCRAWGGEGNSACVHAVLCWHRHILSMENSDSPRCKNVRAAAVDRQSTVPPFLVMDWQLRSCILCTHAVHVRPQLGRQYEFAARVGLPAAQPCVSISVNKYFEVKQVPQLRPVKSKDAIKHHHICCLQYNNQPA